MINRILEKISKVTRPSQEQERLKAELATVTQELEQLRTDRCEFIASLYRYVLQREPSKPEVIHWFQANLTNLELLKIFTESDEYKQLIQFNEGLLSQTNNYYGVLANIEPSGSNYQFLILNTKINDLVDRIYPLNYGMADFIGNRNIVCNPTNCGDFRLSSSGAELETEDLFSEKQFKIERAKFTTLDDLAEKNILSVSDIGFIWMDCQGSEGLIFKGGRNLLQQISVPMYIEFWLYGINRLKCKENYFEFIQNYSSQIFRLLDNKINAVNSEFLFNFYNQHINTGQYFDILLIPN